jgi:hypothetical protein
MTELVPMRVQGSRESVAKALAELQRQIGGYDRPACVVWMPPSWADANDQYADEVSVEILLAMSRVEAVGKLERAASAADPQRQTLLEVNRGFAPLT